MKKILASLLILISVSFIISKTIFTGPWQELKIPGAICGDGKDYAIFYSKGDSKKISLELMGGGACWDESSCWGPGIRTWIHPIPNFQSYSYLTSSTSPVVNYTRIFLPYCTGDVWSGKHTVNYSQTGPTHHHGQINFNKAIAYLQNEKLINLEEVESFLLSGSSAGAIGSLLNLKKLDDKINPQAKKLLIADSPGLHWNKSFWNIFGNKQISDMKELLTDSGINIDLESGIIAKELNNYCDKFNSWNFKFIQSTQDVIMAKLFGKMSYDEFRNNVLGPYGIKETLKNSKNCSTLITEGKGHAYLVLRPYSEYAKSMDTNESIKDYVDRSISEHLN